MWYDLLALHSQMLAVGALMGIAAGQTYAEAVALWASVPLAWSLLSAAPHPAVARA